MIKKFQNPSGKLTYEEALRQAGERVESQMKPSIQVKGVNNSDSRFKFKEKGIKRQFKKEAETFKARLILLIIYKSDIFEQFFLT